MRQLLLLSLAFGLINVPVATLAKDKDKRDYYYPGGEWKQYRDVRDDLKALDKHYDQVKDRVKYLSGGDRRLWDGLHDIRDNIDRIRYQLDDRHSDDRDIRSQIGRAHDDLSHLQAQMEYQNKRRGGYYSRPY
jgi:hypothetical protein